MVAHASNLIRHSSRRAAVVGIRAVETVDPTRIDCAVNLIQSHAGLNARVFKVFPDSAIVGVKLRPPSAFLVGKVNAILLRLRFTELDQPAMLAPLRCWPLDQRVKPTARLI